MTKAQNKKIKELLPLIKAIRERCLDCSAQNSYEVKMCVCPDCPLYRFRMGLKSPKENLTRGNEAEMDINTITEPISDKPEELEANE